MSAAPERLADAQHPWIGLASFTEGDREFFAGRGDEIEELLRLVRRDTLTLLYGVSGLGKTSLLQAGVFPAVRAEDYLPVLIRLEFLDGAPPLSAQVLRAIAAAASAAGVEAPELRLSETLWEYFHRADNHFWSSRNEVVTPFLVFDQFEEAFTLGRETAERIEQVSEFIGKLADLVENRPSPALRDDPQRATEFSFKTAPLRVLLAMREDYLADLDRIRSQFRALSQNRLRLLPMNELQARQVIDLGAPLLAPGVADRIVAFAAGGTASSPGEEIAVAPALLSLVLRELNERRLARGSDAKITSDFLDVEQQKILEDFYLRTLQDFPVGVRNFIEDELLTATGYRDNCALDDALSRPDVTQPILDELVNRRLLSYEDGHRVRRVEITHDVLAPVIKSSRDARHAREATEETERKQVETRQREEAVREQVEAHEKQQETKRRMVVVSVLLGLALAGAWYGFVQARSAKKAGEEVEKTLIHSFERTIGGEHDFMPSYGEREALWDLSKQDREVKELLIDQWVSGADSMKRALAHDARGLHAAIGLEDNHFGSDKAKEGAGYLAKALEDRNETDPERLTSLADALVTLAVRLNPADAASVANELAKALQESQETDPNRLSSLGTALAALSPTAGAPGLARSAAIRLATELENTRKNPDAYALSNLGTALAALTARLSSTDVPDEAKRGATVLTEVMEANQTAMDPYQLWKLGGALAALVAPLNPDGAATAMSGRGATVIANALLVPQRTDSSELWCLGDALAALAGRLDPTTAEDVTKSLVDALTQRGNVPTDQAETGKKTETDPDRLSTLANAIVALAPRLDSISADARANDLSKALSLPKTDPNRLSSLGTALAALAARLEPAAAAPQAQSAATAVADALTKTPAPDPDRLSKLAAALAALAARLEHADAASKAQTGATAVANALKNQQETDPNRLARLGDALAALAAYLDSAGAKSVADSLVPALRQEADPNRLASLGTALAALATRRPSADALALARPAAMRLVLVLKNSQLLDSSRLWKVGNALAALAANIPSARQTRLLGLSNVFLKDLPPPPKATDEDVRRKKTIAKVCGLMSAEDLTEVLKWPFCVGEVRKVVLTAPEKQGIENLDRPATRPSAEKAIEELEALRTQD